MRIPDDAGQDREDCPKIASLRVHEPSEPCDLIKCREQREAQDEALGHPRRRDEGREACRLQKIEARGILGRTDDWVSDQIAPGILERRRETGRHVVLEEDAIDQVAGSVLREPQAVVLPVQQAEQDPTRQAKGDLAVPSPVATLMILGDGTQPGVVAVDRVVPFTIVKGREDGGKSHAVPLKECRKTKDRTTVSAVIQNGTGKPEESLLPERSAAWRLWQSPAQETISHTRIQYKGSYLPHSRSRHLGVGQVLFSDVLFLGTPSLRPRVPGLAWVQHVLILVPQSERPGLSIGNVHDHRLRSW